MQLINGRVVWVLLFFGLKLRINEELFQWTTCYEDQLFICFKINPMVV